MSQTPPNAPPSANDTPFRYNAELANAIEVLWQRRWEERGAFNTPNPGQPGFDASKPKFYCLDMFPYPSGAGLHVGHPEGYTATDIVSRYKRMKGFNVLHPMGWDAFGLPAEQYAIQTGVHPAITTKKAIDNFRRQLQRFGFSYDWSREFGTIDPEYYKWTQWIFLKLYDAWFDAEAAESRSHGVTKGKARPIRELVEEFRSGKRPVAFNPTAGGPHPSLAGAKWDSLDADTKRRVLDSWRLAYLGETTVNWCPKLGTVLANDEVIDGRSERGGHPVLRKPMKQWMFRITAYADRLLDGLAGLDWPASTKAMQTEWIGRSEGAEIEFRIDGRDHALTVFTTRPDTIFGATYMVIAPEHPLVASVAADPAVRAYVERARNLSDIERMENKKKTGVSTGLHALNPATGEKIPVWIADYVLMGYGTGAIMAVPAHDERDYEFAKAFRLPIRDVVYDQTRSAMAYFAKNAPGNVRTAERWQGALADFLGCVTSSVFPHDMQAALDLVTTRRRGEDDGTAVLIPSGRPTERPGAIGERRGATRIVWLDAIAEMKFAGFEDFVDRFARAAFFDASGDAFVATGNVGVLANSANREISLNGLTVEQAKAAIVGWLEKKALGRRRVNYKFRDWTFSRQRYWGEPFPMVFTEDGAAYPVGEKALPVMLPELADYAPVESEDPLPLLGKVREWVNTTAGEAGVDPAVLPPSTKVRREANTMPGSAGSSWYAVRYCDPRNDRAMVASEADRYWMGGNGQPGGVDLYMGGSEHAVGHLMYSRFWHNVLYDMGYLSTPEPFQKLFHQGLITSFAYQRADKTIVPVDEVQEVSEGVYQLIATGEPVTPVVTKMSKRYKNVVNPDDVIAEFGADTFRLYEMYMGPLEASKPWNPRDITGLARFLARAWRVAVDEKTGAVRTAAERDVTVEKQIHRVIAKVGTDIERLSFNTAIASLIEFVNAVGSTVLHKDQLERFMLALAPFAPHLAEEVWSKLGNQTLISLAAWPAVDPAMLRDDEVELAVQIQGKVRCKVTVPSNAEPKAIEEMTLANAEVQKALGGKAVKKIIVVPGRLVNIVAG
jgi:leucyl-tRNA synthetase